MEALFALLAVVFFLAVVIVVPGTIGWWVLGPLDRAAKGRQHPVQFTLGDFLCLFFLAQVAMGAAHSWPDMRGTPAAWGITVFGWVAFALLWAVCVHTLSRAGVTNPWQRGLFLAVVIPLTLAGSMGTPFLGFGILHILFAEPRQWPWLALMVPGEAALLATLYLFGRLTRRIVLVASLPTAELVPEDPEAEEETDPLGGRA